MKLFKKCSPIMQSDTSFIMRHAGFLPTFLLIITSRAECSEGSVILSLLLNGDRVTDADANGPLLAIITVGSSAERHSFFACR